MRQRKRTHSRGPEGWLSQMKADVTSAMESGILCGPMAEAALPETDFARQLERFPVCQLESLPTSRYLLAPKALLQSTPGSCPATADRWRRR